MCVGPWAWLPSAPHMCLLEELAPANLSSAETSQGPSWFACSQAVFKALVRITSHPCSALPLASPFTLDGVSTTFPSTAHKALSAVCTPPFPCLLSSLAFPPW